MRTAALTLAAALALTAAACGTGPSERDGRAVVDRFEAAVERADGAAACAQLTGHLRDSLEDAEGEPCAAAITGLGLEGGGRAGRSRVYITSALVDVSTGESAFLDETPSGWRIAAAGCTRAGEAYRCDLED
jgi:hypothetical protein